MVGGQGVGHGYTHRNALALVAEVTKLCSVVSQIRVQKSASSAGAPGFMLASSLLQISTISSFDKMMRFSNGLLASMSATPATTRGSTGG